MKSYVLQASPATLVKKVEEWAGKDIDLVIMFTSRGIIDEKSPLKIIRDQLPGAQIVGCSTSGEIGDVVEDGSISLMGMKFENSRFRCVSIDIGGAGNSRDAGLKMARALMEDDLKGVFVLLPGVDVNGSKFTLGLKDVLPAEISISGGLAGDGLDFKETRTIHNNDISATHAIGIGFYGDNINIRSQAQGGWKPFGPLRRVTKAENNVLYELDGKSALALYKEYLGDKANDLPSSGLLYPFAIMDDQNKEAAGLIRTILNIDEAAGSLILAGDMEVGQKVCLMHANTDQLVGGAEDAYQGLAEDEAENGAVLCVSCVGRKILMGDDTEDEIDAIRDAMDKALPIAGFYSYGEICHFEGTDQAELHNQTMTITLITEKAA